jgi:hypothetical protein
VGDLGHHEGVQGLHPEVAAVSRDIQKSLVYLWEDGFRSFDERTMTREQVMRLVRRLARKWRVPVPPVDFLPKASRVWSEFDEATGVLTFNYRQCNEAIVCHEMAHLVTANNYQEVEDHGPEFFAIYLEMLVYAKVAPRIALTASAAAKGLRWKREVA